MYLLPRLKARTPNEHYWHSGTPEASPPSFARTRLHRRLPFKPVGYPVSVDRAVQTCRSIRRGGRAVHCPDPLTTTCDLHPSAKHSHARSEGGGTAAYPATRWHSVCRRVYVSLFVGCMSSYWRAPAMVGWHGQHTSEGGHEVPCEERLTDVPGGSTLPLLAYDSRHRGR